MIKLHQGDSGQLLKGFADNTFTGIVTDPPYGLKLMGKRWDYDIPKRALWAECLRVVKPGGHMLCFGGTRTFHRLAVEIEDAGWLIRDCMMWVYGSGFPKSANISKHIDKKLGGVREVVGHWKPTGTAKPNKGQKGHSAARTSAAVQDYSREESALLPITKAATPQAEQWEGYGTALKPTWEPILVCMKPLDGSYAENALWHGVAGINIDGSRIATQDEYHYPNGPGGKSAHYTREERSAEGRPNPTSMHKKGRWPANFMLGHAEGCRLIGTKSVKSAGWRDKDKPMTGNVWGGGEKGIGTTVGPHYAGPDGREIMEEWECVPGCAVSIMDKQSSGASRFYYCAKPNKKERGVRNIHPTVKPLDLIRYLVEMIKMPHNTHILEPFAGSGTTLAACMALGIDCTGIEMQPEYVELIKDRLGLL